MPNETSFSGNNVNHPLKIFNRSFISIFIANIMLNLGIQLVQTLVAKYVKFLGAEASIIGVITSLYALTALIFKIFAAPAIDSLNRKKIAIAAMGVLAIAFTGYAISSTLSVVVISRLLQGAGQAFSATCFLALATDALPKAKLSTGIALYSLAQTVSQAIGPTIGLALSTAIGYNYTFAVSSLFMVIGIAASCTIATKRVTTKMFKISAKNIIAKEAILSAVILFFLMLAFCNINSFLAIYAEERNVSGNIGLFFTVYALTLLITRPTVGRLTDKFGMVKVAIPSMACFALSFLIISVSTKLWMFLVAAIISAFGFGACQPVMQSFCMKSVSPDRRGAGSSTNYIGQDLANLLGPMLSGVVIENVGYETMWRVMLIPICAAIVLTIIFRKYITNVEKLFEANNS